MLALDVFAVDHRVKDNTIVRNQLQMEPVGPKVLRDSVLMSTPVVNLKHEDPVCF